MVTTPADTPVTIPDVKPTVAIEVLLLVHEPPVTESVSVLVPPTHTLGVPMIGGKDKEEVTVNTTYAPQPLVST